MLEKISQRSAFYSIGKKKRLFGIPFYCCIHRLGLMARNVILKNKRKSYLHILLLQILDVSTSEDCSLFVAVNSFCIFTYLIIIMIYIVLKVFFFTILFQIPNKLVCFHARLPDNNRSLLWLMKIRFINLSELFSTQPNDKEDSNPSTCFN